GSLFVKYNSRSEFIFAVISTSRTTPQSRRRLPLISSHHWSRNFKVDTSDIEFLNNYLLEREIPLSTEELARALLQARLDRDSAAVEERFRDVNLYNPANTYEIGQKLMFPALDYSTAT